MKQEDLINIAKNACKNAYSPSTGYMVGAALLSKSGTVYIGVNVEDEKIPNLSICAERNAMSTAIAAGEKSRLKAVAIYSPKTKLCWPCGACRQWFCEFEQGQGMKIVVEDKDGKPAEFTVDELIPHRFELIP